MPPLNHAAIETPFPPDLRRGVEKCTNHVCQRLDGQVSGPRIALYSHDTMGLGHLRRNLLIAKTLAAAPLNASNLLITGAHEANFFRLPERADCLTLPRLSKSSCGDYTSGQLEMSLCDLTELRARSICSALEVFRPDVFIVDKVPTGAFDELILALEMLASHRTTRCVLGLRDILDDPATVSREWLKPENVRAIERFYDAIWVYGDETVYDPVREYGLQSSIAGRMQFTGYIDQSGRVSMAESKTSRWLDMIGRDLPIVACLVGGGQDGAAIARAFIEAMPRSGRVGVLVTGPFMSQSELECLTKMAARCSNIHVMDFVPEADLLIERAEKVVAMAGYNTVCSLLSFGKHALLVPRTHPRREQLIRAERLQQLGLVDMVVPEKLNRADLRNWILCESSQPRRTASSINFRGLSTLTELTRSLVAGRSSSVTHVLSLARG